MGMNSIAACLIVKNEGLVIKRCLESVRDLVQAVVIVDTGSTDNTIDVIRSLEFPFQIEIYERPWVDFAHNRTELLRLASRHADYLLLLDADQTVTGAPPELKADAYCFPVRMPQGTEFMKHGLIRAALPWRFEGAVHEFLVCEQAAPAVQLSTFRVNEHGDGGRRPPGTQPRWEWDADVLERELVATPTDSRNIFYLARTYDDLASTRPNEPSALVWRQKAIARYEQRAAIKSGYADEAFYSLLRLGVLQLESGLGLARLLEAWQKCPTRWEPVHLACRWLNQVGLYMASYALSSDALSKAMAPSGLFAVPAVYDYLLLFEHSISADWTGHHQESLDACNALLAKPQIPSSIREAVNRNIVFPLRKLGLAQSAPDEAPAPLAASNEVHVSTIASESNEGTANKRLHLGCGRTVLPGWINLDWKAGPGIDLVADLNACSSTKLPLEDNSIDAFLGSHVIEHIVHTLPLMQELHRIAKPDARAVFHVPYGSSDDAFEDPTHVRQNFLQSFGYFSQPYYWRADYGYRGDWLTERITLKVSKSTYEGKPREAIFRDIHTLRNVVIEMTVEMRAMKPIREPRRELQVQPVIDISLV